MTKLSTEVRLDEGEAVARLFTRTLTVPQVFFEAAWPDIKQHVDILAIDRAGSGDVHVVEMKSRFDLVTTSVIRQLDRAPSHYRWVAVPVQGVNEHLVRNLVTTLAKSGIGLIGIEVMANGEAGANVISKPSRAASFDRTIIGDFLKKRVPDIEYGEAPRASAKDQTSPLPKKKVQQYLNEADSLLELGHQRAAYLLAWSATEAAMKRLLNAPEQSPMPSPGALVRELRESGKLTAPEVNSLSNALNIRNMLVHGLDDPRGVREAYRFVTTIARRMIKA